MKQNTTVKIKMSHIIYFSAHETFSGITFIRYA